MYIPHLQLLKHSFEMVVADWQYIYIFLIGSSTCLEPLALHVLCISLLWL